MTRMPSFFALARLITGSPFKEGRMVSVRGDAPSNRMRLASVPAARPCS